MYQFNYQNLVPEDKPIFSCIVPTNWLSRKLPTMGGDVVYVDKQSPIETLTDCVFEFSEQLQKGLSRTIYLDIYHRNATEDNLSVEHTKIFAAPAIIHCCAIEDHDVNDDWCNEVLLLNHFFGWNALTASVGNVYLDFADLISVMSKSSEFVFEFGIGETPTDILPGILDRLASIKAKCLFAMIFCKQQMMRLAYIREVSGALDSDDALLLLSDVAVDQEKMLISVLVGR